MGLDLGEQSLDRCFGSGSSSLSGRIKIQLHAQRLIGRVLPSGSSRHALEKTVGAIVHNADSDPISLNRGCVAVVEASCHVLSAATGAHTQIGTNTIEWFFEIPNLMLTLQPTLKPRRRRAKAPKIGLAVAGGGPVGGMYELGALRALDEAIEGLRLTDLEVYVGVSSGAFLASGLANQLSTADMCRIFLTDDLAQGRFRPEVFLRPAFQEYLRRAAAIPQMIGSWLLDIIRNPDDNKWTDVVGRLGAIIPTGLFDNAEIERFLRTIFASFGRSNDFRELAHRLYVVAVDIDSGETVRFGAPGFDHVPISRAVQASSALPGLYPPVEIDQHWYVDGALRRTLHASVALDAGAELVIGINPLVPFDASMALRNGLPVPSSLIEGGLPAVLSQTFRTLLKSRMQVGLDKYQTQYEHADIVLFEPRPDDTSMFFTNVFSYESRHKLAQHAYSSTLADLAAHADKLRPVLARHGLSLRESVIHDRDRELLDFLGQRPPRKTSVTLRLRHALDDLERNLQARAR